MSSRKVRKIKVRSKKYFKKHSKKMLKKHRKHKVRTRKLKYYRGGATKPQETENKNAFQNLTDGIVNNKGIKKLQRAASFTQKAAAIVGEKLGPDKEEKIELLKKEIKDKTKKLNEMKKKEKERSEKEQKNIKKLSDEIEKHNMELKTLTGAPPMKRASTMPLPVKSPSQATKPAMAMKQPAMATTMAMKQPAMAMKQSP